jgi:acetyltransferase
MTVGRPAKKRLSLERVFRPASLALAGTATPAGQRLRANIEAGNFAGHVAFDDCSHAPDLAVLACPAEAMPAALKTLAAGGGQTAIVISQADGVAAMAREAGVRVFGPNAFGLAVPGLGLNASLSHIGVPAGRVALVTQSTSMARAVIDWAGPNGVGFSHVVGLGGNADLGFTHTLDWLSRDPGTGLILLDIRRIKDARAFISAARAASRLRPVVAVRAGGRLLDPSGRSAAVFEQALHRAGVFVVDGMEALFAATEIFATQAIGGARPLRHETLAVVTNAIGPGRFACDAALRAGIALAELPPEVQAALCGTLPAELVQGLVYVGRLPMHVAEAAAMLSAVPGVGGVLLVMTPTGPADPAAIEAVLAAVQTAKLPVLSCIMGETSGAAHRLRLAQAGMPVFATPEQAVAAFADLLQDRRARASARELPPARVLEVAPHPEVFARVAEAARRMGREDIDAAGCREILQAYGMPACPMPASGIRAEVTAQADPMFGPALALSVDGGAPVFDLPPLNLALAQAMARRAGLAGNAAVEAAATALVRISQLLVDAPVIATLRAGLLIGDRDAAAADCSMTLRPPGMVGTLAIAPYPDQWVSQVTLKGQAFTLRPIRPEDAEAHAAMIARVPAEDLRFRFFTAVRQVSAEQMVRLTQIDYAREMAFIAVRNADASTVGVSRLVCEPESQTGEFAILVEPSVKGLGLGKRLMQRLFDWAETQQLLHIEGQVLADNHPMLGFVRHLGFTTRVLPEEPDVVEAVMTLQ